MHNPPPPPTHTHTRCPAPSCPPKQNRLQEGQDPLDVRYHTRVAAADRLLGVTPAPSQMSLKPSASDLRLPSHMPSAVETQTQAQTHMGREQSLDPLPPMPEAEEEAVAQNGEDEEPLGFLLVCACVRAGGLTGPSLLSWCIQYRTIFKDQHRSQRLGKD